MFTLLYLASCNLPFLNRDKRERKKVCVCVCVCVCVRVCVWSNIKEGSFVFVPVQYKTIEGSHNINWFKAGFL